MTVDVSMYVCSVDGEGGQRGNYYEKVLEARSRLLDDDAWPQGRNLLSHAPSIEQKQSLPHELK